MFISKMRDLFSLNLFDEILNILCYILIAKEEHMGSCLF